ncbi:MAG: hemoglobin [Myxococcota bacterium]|jgi:hemoglobin
MSQTLYQKYGGSASITAIVHDFYVRVLADDGISHHFVDIDMARLVNHQANYIAKALGGPEVYDDKDIALAHQRLGIDNDAFDSVAGHLSDALHEAGVEGGDCKTVLELVGSLRSDIVTS